MRRTTKRSYNESGRSMLEMLGVLLVIGLISTIGLTSFRWVMDTLHANETKERLNKRAWEVSNSILTNEPASIDQFKTNDGVYLIDTLVLSTNTFSMTVHGVPPDVCRKLVECDASDISNAAVSSGGNCEQTGDMVFVFDNHLDSHSLCSGFESSACVLSCNDETGYTFAAKGTSCGSARHYCDGKGHCVYDSKCTAENGEGYFAGEPDGDGNYSCFPCDLESSQQTTLDECNACPDRFWQSGECFPVCANGSWRDSEGICRECSWDQSAITSSAECYKCSNHYFEAFEDGTGRGRCYPRCGDDTFRDLNGTCYPCDHAESVVSSKNECDYCAARTWLNGACYPTCGDSMQNLQDGSCVACEDSEAVRTTQEDCYKCDGHYWYNGSEDIVEDTANYAQYSDRVDDYRVNDLLLAWDYTPNSGEATSVYYCTKNLSRCVKGHKRLTTEELRALYYSGTFTQNTDMEPQYEESTSGICFAACSGGFHEIRGSCINCDEGSAYKSTEIECNRCEHRVYNSETGMCTGACASGFMSLSGDCHECSWGEMVVTASASACNACSNRYFVPFDSGETGTTEQQAGNCWPPCTTSNEEKGFRRVGGECQQCQDPTTSVALSQTECEACPGRFYNTTTQECFRACSQAEDLKEFRNIRGECQDCAAAISDETSVIVSSEEACTSACGDLRYAVAVGDGTFKCVAGCGSGHFETLHNGCQECDYMDTEAEYSQCSLCEGRWWKADAESGENNCFKACESLNFRTISGECISCSDTEDGNREDRTAISQSECEGTCPGRWWKAKTQGGECWRACDAGLEFRNTSGKCQSCSSTSTSLEDVSVLSDGECSDCETARYVVPQNDNTFKCFKACDTGYFGDASGGCHSCSDPGSYETIASECARCPDERTQNGNLCVLLGNECGAGQFKTLDNVCVPCSEKSMWPLESRESTWAQCNLCPRSQREYDTNYGMCIPICGQGQFRNDYVDPNTGIRSRSCTDCSNTSGKGTTAEECRACDDTAYPREMANGKCVLKTTCEEGKYKDKNGACRLCKWTDWTEYDTEGVTGYEVKDEAACKDACGDDRDTRIVDGVLKCVPAQCPWGQYQNTNGNCTGCWRRLEKPTSEAQCNLCEEYAEQYASHGLAQKPNWEHTYKSGKCKKKNWTEEPLVFASP